MKQIILILAGIAILGFAGVRIHQVKELQSYEVANNCQWVATGTHFGDDRDFICITK